MEVAQPSAPELRNARSERLGNNLGGICSPFPRLWAQSLLCGQGAGMEPSLPHGAGGAVGWLCLHGFKTSGCFHALLHMQLCT